MLMQFSYSTLLRNCKQQLANVQSEHSHIHVFANVTANSPPRDYTHPDDLNKLII